MIAGFFLFIKTDFTQSFFDFAKKKLMRFMPTVVFVLLLFLILSFFTPIGYDKYNNIFILLNLQNVGFTYRTGNIGASWFLSSLFWTMCFYFYLYKICDKRWFNLITACTIFFCYSFFIHCHVKHFQNEAFVFNVGMMRAFAGIGVGYFLSMIYKENIDTIKAKTLNIWQKLLITGIEIYLLAFTFYYLCLHKMHYDNKMIMIVAFIGLLSLFFIKKGYFSQMLNNNLSVFVGQFTFAIFLTHELIIKLWEIYVCKAHSGWVIAHPVENLTLLFATIIIFGMLTYYCVEKPCARYFNKTK